MAQGAPNTPNTYKGGWQILGKYTTVNGKMTSSIYTYIYIPVYTVYICVCVCASINKKANIYRKDLGDVIQSINMHKAVFLDSVTVFSITTPPYQFEHPICQFQHQLHINPEKYSLIHDHLLGRSPEWPCHLSPPPKLRWERPTWPRQHARDMDQDHARGSIWSWWMNMNEYKKGLESCIFFEE